MNRFFCVVVNVGTIRIRLFSGFEETVMKKDVEKFARKKETYANVLLARSF